MEKNEVGKLFTLLGQFYPNKQLSENMKLAWGIALEPYRYGDVKTAAVAYVRRNKFFPDVADLTAGLETTEDKPAEKPVDRKAEAAWMRKYINADHGGLGRISRCARERDITWDEAKAVLDG